MKYSGVYRKDDKSKIQLKPSSPTKIKHKQNNHDFKNRDVDKQMKGDDVQKGQKK